VDARELTIAEIATQYDVSPATIYRRLSLLERINLSIELIDASNIIVTESTPDQRKSVLTTGRLEKYRPMV
jgi:predicted DNA-binding transcriptional regulator YafY